MNKGYYLVSIIASSSLQWFDTVGFVMGTSSGRQKPVCSTWPIVCLSGSPALPGIIPVKKANSREIDSVDTRKHAHAVEGNVDVRCIVVKWVEWSWSVTLVTEAGENWPGSWGVREEKGELFRRTTTWSEPHYLLSMFVLYCVRQQLSHVTLSFCSSLCLTVYTESCFCFDFVPGTHGKVFLLFVFVSLLLGRRYVYHNLYNICCA